MTDAKTILSQLPVEKALDYEALRADAIRFLEQTTSNKWTDYNVHDPGITILELLCYTLTDLGYRTEHTIPDLLADESNNRQKVVDHFFTAKQILPNKPATVTDYRKLLIDIEGVKNAWLIRQSKTIFLDKKNKRIQLEASTTKGFEKVLINGYYNVLLEFDLQITEGEKEAIIAKAKALLAANRNVCEDFLEVSEVQQQKFILCAEIDLEPLADVHQTIAEALLNIQLHLNPFIQFYSLQQLLQANVASEKIFEGTLLNNGFIRDDELQNTILKTEIHLSDIMQQILQVEGVSGISDIVFNTTLQSTPLANKWIIKVEDGKQPFLQIDACKILVVKNGMPVRPDMAKVKAIYQQLYDDLFANNEAKTTDDISFDTGNYVAASQYYSVQNHFPKNYGISHWGLPADATEERKAQAKQLNGYLWLFDQLMANYVSQLGHLRHLFSMSDVSQTYFTQLVADFKNSEAIFKNASTLTDDLQKGTENEALFHERRNAFLNHLLSRFGESFYNYISILHTINDGIDEKKVIQAKESFLKNYPAYSCERFMAPNYTNADATWDTGNISGVEKRLQRLLGFENIDRRNLTNAFKKVEEGNEGGSAFFTFKIIDNKKNEAILASVTSYTAKDVCETVLNEAWALAGNTSNYKVVKTDDGKFIYQLILEDEVLAISAINFNTKKAAENALKDVIALMASTAEEGMFMVEHLLLLPEVDDAFLPVCVSGNTDDFLDKDPYSFRVSYVLPAYAPRFLHMDFRNYAEQVIRMETPAHLFPKICWVDNEQLQQFESAYKSWLAVKAGADDDEQRVLKKFVAVLTSLKTVYPITRLQDCKTGEERKLFLLNQNALGTFKS